MVIWQPGIRDTDAKKSAQAVQTVMFIGGTLNLVRTAVG